MSIASCGLGRDTHNPGRCRTVSVDYAAEVLGISRNTAFALVRKGEIPALVLGKRRLVPVQWLESKVGPIGEAA